MKSRKQDGESFLSTEKLVATLGSLCHAGQDVTNSKKPKIEKVLVQEFTGIPPNL